MIRSTLTAEADAAAQRYGLLTAGWRADYLETFQDPHFGTARQVADLREKAYDLARRHLDAERTTIASVFERVALEAQRATQAQLRTTTSDTLADAAGEHLVASQQYVQTETSIQIERDIQHVMQSMRKAAMSVTIAARAGRTSLKSSLMQYRLSQVNDIEFFSFDRRNAKWSSRKFVRALWRMQLLATYNETVLLTLADHGEERAFITYLDPKAPLHGTEISVNAGSALPVYEQIKAEVFHPNSEALLTRAL